jgi:subtilisin family serine protease
MKELEALLGRTPEELTSMPLLPVEVVVVDSGVDASHPDLSGRVTAAVHVVEIEPGKIISETLRPGACNDSYGHGTGVASIIARIAHNARIVDVRVLDAHNVGSGAALVAGIEWAVARRSPVINLSLVAKSRFAVPLHRACEQAYRQGQAIVAARRNVPLADEGFPAEFSSVIAVDRGTVRSPTGIAYRPGAVIEYAAHGQDMIVAASGGGYTTATGTSFATPVVAGLCALLLGADPALRPFEIKSLLKRLGSWVGDAG